MAGSNKKSKGSKSKAVKDIATEETVAAVKALPQEQQLQALISHYNELSVQQAALKSNLATAEKANNQLNSDYTKAMLSKGQLESLCRELQKQNKVTKEENIARVREEEEKRRDVSNRLNTTLADLTGLMQQNSDKNNELRQENMNMAVKLKELAGHYESRQTEVDKILHQRDLQLQLADARLAKAGIESTEYKEISLKEKKKLLEELQLYHEKVAQQTSIEITLRTQLEKYSSEYQTFQKTVEASTTIMDKFKKEMDLMTKRIKLLEKETNMWQEKWQKSNITLLDMATERQNVLGVNDKLTKRNVKLQELCRSMQTMLAEERKRYRTESETATTNGIDDAIATDVRENAGDAATPTAISSQSKESSPTPDSIVVTHQKLTCVADDINATLSDIKVQLEDMKSLNDKEKSDNTNTSECNKECNSSTVEPTTSDNAVDQNVPTDDTAEAAPVDSVKSDDSTTDTTSFDSGKTDDTTPASAAVDTSNTDDDVSLCSVTTKESTIEITAL